MGPRPGVRSKARTQVCSEARTQRHKPHAATPHEWDSCPAPPRLRIRSWARTAARACRRARRLSRRRARAVLLGMDTTPWRWFQT